jgi:AraC-like DNA-binding protein
MRSPLVTELVMFNFGRLPPHNVTRPHLHTFHQLDVVLEGRVQHTVEGIGTHALSSGGALLIAPLARHESRSEAGFVHASFKLTLGPQAGRRLGSCMIFRPSSAATAMLVEAGHRLARQESDAAEGVLVAASLLVVEALRAQPALEVVAPPLDDFRRLVLPVLQPVDENPTAEWTVEAMADRCNLSVDYFSRCFHQALRQTPKQYLLTARMRKAAMELLASPPVAIKQVAHRLGYSSVQTFSRAFRCMVGVSPAAFRAAPRDARISSYF